MKNSFLFSAAVLCTTFVSQSTFAQNDSNDIRKQAHEEKINEWIQDRVIKGKQAKEILSGEKPGIENKVSVDESVALNFQIERSQSSIHSNTESFAKASYYNNPLQIMHTFGKGEAPGNLTVSPDNRVFMSLHQFYSPEHKVVEVMPNGDLVPYPNEEWNAGFDEDNSLGTFNGVLGIQCDRRGILWLLDRAPGPGESGKLVAWDTTKEKLHRVIRLRQPDIAEQPFLNDLAVDRTHNAIYITDTATPEDAALVVVDLTTGYVRRVLEGSEFTVPEDIDMVIDDRTIMMGGESARIGANPITVDPTNEWVYFGPMSGTKLYRIRTTDLLDWELDDRDLERRVEIYGIKPICDGITVDNRGNVYISSITENAISVLSPNMNIHMVEVNGDEMELPFAVHIYKDERLSWPDAFAISPEDEILVAVNQLHRSAPLSGTGEDISNGEYYILKFESPFAAVEGR